MNGIHLAPASVAWSELLLAGMIGIIIGIVIGVIVTSYLIKKRFPLKLRNVNKLKRKYKRQVETVKHRESIIYFIYKLTSKMVDMIAAKIKEIESY